MAAFIGRIPPLGWMLGFLVPPFLTSFVQLSRVWRRRTSKSRELPKTPRGMSKLEADFRAALEQLVPDVNLRDHHRLAAALQAAGVEQPVAAHAARVRDRLQQAIYGPNGATDPDELTAEVRELLKMLPRGSVRANGFVSVGTVVGLLIPFSGVGAQSPEQLYDAGAYRQAADSFQVRTMQAPNEPVHWFNYGLSLYGASEVTHARAAWIKAARLEPRNLEIRSAMRQEAPLDPLSQQMTWISPLTTSEILVAAIVFWVLGWLLVLARRRARWFVPMLACAVLCAGFAWYVMEKYREDVAFVVSSNTPLRVAPYGSAAASRTLERDTAVRVQRTDGAWILIERGDARGWLLADEVAPI